MFLPCYAEGFILEEAGHPRIPDALNVRSSYGIGARPESVFGQRFVDFVMSEQGQAILKAYGFN